MLADSVVALVIGQIQQATSQTQTGRPGFPARLLRAYNTKSRANTHRCYKLYSTTNLASMTDTTGNLNFFTNDVPSNWSSYPINTPI